MQMLRKVIGDPEGRDKEKGEKDRGEAGEGRGAEQPRQRQPLAPSAYDQAAGDAGSSCSRT